MIRKLWKEFETQTFTNRLTIHLPDDSSIPIPLTSLVGIITRTLVTASHVLILFIYEKKCKCKPYYYCIAVFTLSYRYVVLCLKHKSD